MPSKSATRLSRLKAGASSAEVWIARPDSNVLRDMVAAWSPDENQVAYIWRKKTGALSTLQLWIMDEDRQNRRLVAEVSSSNPGSVVASDDGFRKGDVKKR